MSLKQLDVMLCERMVDAIASNYDLSNSKRTVPPYESYFMDMFYAQLDSTMSCLTKSEILILVIELSDTAYWNDYKAPRRALFERYVARYHDCVIVEVRNILNYKDSEP